MSGAIRGASASWRRAAPTTAISRGARMPEVVRQARPYRMCLGVTLILLGVLVGGCAWSPTHDPGKAELLRQIREAYLFDVDVASLDPDTRLVEVRRRMSLDFIRGFEPEGSVVDVRELGSGRGYLRLVFFGRRTLEDVRKALNSFTPPLCALTIDLRDNTGGSFEQALRLAELFLLPSTPLALYEGREGRALLYATGTAAPRQERLTLWINAGT